MKDFIEELFDKKHKLNFQYMDYDMAFYEGEYHSFCLIFFLKSQEELMSLWKDTGEIFQMMKKNREIYCSDMDKNTLCVYCLEVTSEDYYQTETTGTISELSKKISLIEEDLDYFTKHVLLYTKDMDQFSQQHVGEFDDLCRRYIVDEEFEKYKQSSQGNYEYDFLINLFIKLPFLRFEKYQMGKQKEYRTVISFVQEKMKEHSVNMGKVKEEIEQLEEITADENEYYTWLDTLIEKDDVNNTFREENK